MDDHNNYVLPQKNKRELTRNSFIIYIVFAAILILIFINLLDYLIFKSNVGYFPYVLVIVVADLFYLIGCYSYIKKHKYAYGEQYEYYQIINSEIYGLQNYLKVFLVALVISVLVIPVYYLITLIIFVSLLGLLKRKMI